jgi:hypothetical protein
MLALTLNPVSWYQYAGISGVWVAMVRLGAANKGQI